jgi:thioesterase domain-containing protein
MRIQADIDRHVPMARGMQMCLARASPDGVRVTAPLGPNRNLIGTAFAGSLVTIATVAGWALTQLTLLERDLIADVVVSESHIKYLRPLREDIEALAHPPSSESLTHLIAVLEHKGIGRWDVEVAIATSDLQPVASFSGTYVATLKR